MAYEKRQKAVDLQHHISDFARRRAPSPLKGLQKYFKPGSYMLAGGQHHHDQLNTNYYHDMLTTIIHGKVYLVRLTSPSAVSVEKPWCQDRSQWPHPSVRPRFPGYGNFLVQALPPTRKPQRWQFLSMQQSRAIYVYRPHFNTVPLLPSPNYRRLCMNLRLRYINLHTKILQLWFIPVTRMGWLFPISLTIVMSHWRKLFSWHRIVATLCNKGEAIIVSEWTYPSALYSIIPYEVTVAPVPMDGQGMRADCLRTMLQSWDETARGAPR